jgi:hypothetical protein
MTKIIQFPLIESLTRSLVNAKGEQAIARAAARLRNYHEQEYFKRTGKWVNFDVRLKGRNIIEIRVCQ